jgi:glycosyltransferase involved in cell wall biosynthesis
MLAKQSYPQDRLEVLVICDGGTDGSAEMARNLSFPFELRVFEQANHGPAAARNLGVDEARGSIALFLDDDVLAGPSLVAEHAAAHSATPDAVVIAPLLPPGSRQSPWVRWEARGLDDQYFAMRAGRWAPTPRQFYTGNASVQVSHLKRAGGFDTSYSRAEDVELAFRLWKMGLQFLFHPAAGAVHIADRSFVSWLRAAYEYGRSDARIGTSLGPIGMLGVSAAEFHSRHAFTRWFVRWGLGHPRMERALVHGARSSIASAELIGLSKIAELGCGAIFNLCYWLGASQVLGGPSEVLALIDSESPSAKSDRGRAAAAPDPNQTG